MKTDNFDKIVGQDKYVALKFYTKWCKYCRLMAPYYDQLHEDFKGKREDIVIARIDANENEEIAFKYGIHSFPILVLFKPGSQEIAAIFREQRVTEVMAEWLEKNCPKIKTEEVEKVVENSDNSTIVKTPIKEAGELKNNAEYEFLKSELILLKYNVDNLNKEFENLRKQNNETLSNKSSNDKIQHNFNVPSAKTIIVFCVILVVLFAALLTCRKIFNNKSGLLKTDIEHHHKV